MYTLLAGAMGTTVEGSVSLDSVAQDFAAAMIAGRRKSVDRAFKAIECV